MRMSLAGQTSGRFEPTDGHPFSAAFFACVTMNEPDRSGTFASRVLARLPEIRKQALGSPDFQSWLKTHRSVVVDGAPFYVVGGDMLRDQDEMIVSWARRQGLVDQPTIARLQAEEDTDRTP